MLLRRIIKTPVEREEIAVPEEVRRSDVQCIYTDQNGVFLSLKNGRVYKVDHTFREMEDYFIRK